MIRKLELILGASLLAAILALTAVTFMQRAALTAAHNHAEVLSGDANANKTYARGLTALVAQEKSADERMDQALAANPEWRDGAVPDDVARLLCHGADAACRVPAADADH